MLRPMSNLFAVSHRDIGFLDGIEENLRHAGEFDLIWRPARTWVAARAALPEGEPDSELVRAKGVAFLEGRDGLERGRGVAWLDRVMRLTDSAPHRLHELAGDFGFVRFRPDGTAAAVRSCAGLVPLYVHRSTSDALAVGTRLSYFPRFLPGRFEPDPLINVSFNFACIFIDGRTFVEGIGILPRASHSEIAADHAPRTVIYWDPRPDEGAVLRPSRDHPIELRRLLVETLDRDLDQRGRNLISLSGGVDSSALAALAAGVVGRQLSSISVIPGHEPDRTRELSYIDQIATKFEVQPAVKVEESAEAWSRWATQHCGLPFQASHPVLAELPRVCQQQEVRVLFGGEGADDVCGDWSRYGDWLRHTNALALTRTAPKNLPYGSRDVLRWMKQRALRAIGRPLRPGPPELDRWAHPEVEAEFRDWLIRRENALRSDRRPLLDLAVLVEADGWVPMNWEGTSPLGVRRSLPFFERGVLELAFQCHPSELLGPGPKRLLKIALKDDVPARNLFRAHSGAWNTEFERSQLPPLSMPRGAERMIRADWLPTPPPDASFEDLMLIWDPLSVAQWLEETNVARAQAVAARTSAI